VIQDTQSKEIIFMGSLTDVLK